MTEEEFVAWLPEDVRAEWVDGEVIVMSPANDAHDDLFVWLLSAFSIFVNDRGLGRVHGDQFMTQLESVKQRRVPDLSFVAKERIGQIRRGYVDGPPDMVVEIVSPDSVERDRVEKYQAYAAAGVLEYWIIDPDNRTFDAFWLDSGKYHTLAVVEGWVTSRAIAGLRLKVEWLWPDSRPSSRDLVAHLLGRA